MHTPPNKIDSYPSPSAYNEQDDDHLHDDARQDQDAGQDVLRQGLSQGDGCQVGARREGMDPADYEGQP